MEDQIKDLIMLRAVEHAKRSEFDEAISCINQILSEEPYDTLALFNKGFTLRMAGRTDEAAGVFTELLEVQPTPGVFHQLGLIASSQGEMTKALGYFSRATTIHPADAESWYQTGVVQFTMGRIREAKESFLQASVFEPDNSEIWDQLGLCYQKEGEMKEALRSFDRALEVDPGSEPILYHKARVLEQLGRRADEIACYDALILQNPESMFPWLKKGLALMMAENYRLSLHYFSIACRLPNPGHMPFLLKGLVHSVFDQYGLAVDCFKEAETQSPDDTDIILHLGRALGASGRHEEALEAFTRILTKKPHSLEAEEGKARSLYHLKRWDELVTLCIEKRTNDQSNQIWYLLEAKVKGWETGEQDKAMDLLLEGILQNPAENQLHLTRADLLIEMQKHEEAIRILKDSLEQARDPLPFLYRIGTILGEQKKYAEAVPYLDRAIQLRPEDSHLKYLAGEAAEHLRDLDTALDYYSKALIDTPDDPGLWLARARVLIIMGSADDALASARQATSLSDEWYDAWIMQGRAEIEAELPEDARKTFTLATLITPDNPEGWRFLGEVLFSVREVPAAIVAYDRALSLDYSDHDARNGKIQALLHIGEWESALQEFEIALSLKGDNFWDLFGIAMILFDDLQEEKGRSFLERAEPFATGEVGALTSLGNAWCEVYEFARADDWYSLALQLDPESAEIWSRRGYAFKDAGNHEEAIASFDKALELNPEDGDVYENREESISLLLAGDHTPIHERYQS